MEREVVSDAKGIKGTAVPRESDNISSTTIFNKKMAPAATMSKKVKWTSDQLLNDFSISLCDLVALVHPQLSPLLATQDAYNLILVCPNALQQDMRDNIATEALWVFYRKDHIHFGLKCYGDWHQIMPLEARGARVPCVCTHDELAQADAVPRDLLLPKTPNARTNLLETMCLVSKGIEPFCFQLLGVAWSWIATLQPFVYSLAEGLEKRRGRSKKLKDNATVVDTDNAEELVRLLEGAQPGFGLNFFNSRNSSRRRAGINPFDLLEKPWKGIKVDQSSGRPSCDFCKRRKDIDHNYTDPFLSDEDNDGVLRAHCLAVYQPLKKFMVQHLKHVRYLRPADWTRDVHFAGRYPDIIAGFTPAGVLCGVHVTDVPREVRSSG